jgi:hypothetical protein
MSSPLTLQEMNELNESLHYCKVQELKDICCTLHIPDKGKKPHLIATITSFIKSGTILTEKKIPAASCKQPGINYPLLPETRMVYGAFKNDLATRIFFKKLIGNHFYYTVFGLDWIKQQWMAGEPPTYAEFAAFWQREYLSRQGKVQDLKPEWAYLNFAREFKEKYPTASKTILLSAWEDIRLQHKKHALSLINKFLE